MLRKMIVAALAVAAVGLSAPQAAQARGGGFHHGGGFHGGWRGHWHGGGFWPGFGLGGYYGYGYPYYYDYPYYYGTGYEGYGGCYIVRKRVMTKAGWRIRRVDVCE